MTAVLLFFLWYSYSRPQKVSDSTFITCGTLINFQFFSPWYFYYRGTFIRYFRVAQHLCDQLVLMCCSCLQKCGNNILGSQLLLPLRKPSSHNGTRRCIEVLLVSLVIFQFESESKDSIRQFQYYKFSFFFSLQFDPAPRRGEPHVTRRTPDYFL